MNAADIQNLVSELGAAAQLVETHISWVILADEFAYKIKKPVHFSFLDFTTVAQREMYCLRELELNKRLAPTVYLEVVPVVEHHGHLRWGDQSGRGAVVDHALKMRRLDAGMEMDKMLEAGRVPLEYMGTLAHKIAAFHGTAAIINNPAQSSPEGYQSDFNDIVGQLSVFSKELGAASAERLQAIVTISDIYLAAHGPLIRARLTAGMVRDVHGDLHAANIFAYPDPVVFDCIEFNDHFRQIDVLNEVAFCCMDLEARGFEGHSEAFMQAYLQEFKAIRVPEENLLFLWFKCYRANVRAKVTALRAAQAGANDEIRADLKRYLDLMERYAGRLKAAEVL